ncbi:uncharacterized protein LOC106181669 [Lingula anatina]|uniref:Uncharacterized protein LOC106181669 n=1 Tax=Lingula anatina TaxID=7574 RepID=A0A1S3KG07_LINAN|nr:uncharacterized protein LOC106181669 [Lingula anatina]|eukprot:XP_013421570.1 uncharacterized protein LOC106181669 [Lingula anatina]
MLGGVYVLVSVFKNQKGGTVNNMETRAKLCLGTLPVLLALILGYFRPDLTHVLPGIHSIWSDVTHAPPDAGDVSQAPPKGHMQKFGLHVDKEKELIVMDHFPSPEDFYRDHMRQSVPLVVRGSLKHWPAVEKWNNEDYLREKFGNREFTVMFKKSNDHSHKSHMTMSMTDFLDRYRDEHIYMDATLSPEMTEDLTIPRFLGCDAIMKMMKQFAVFFNAGWSSTYIHVDATETLFAQITGQRQWILIPPAHGKYLYVDDFNYHRGISPVEPEAVDLIKFPNISKVDIYNITLYEGDIIYVPEGWYHQVRTMGGPPNMAMAIFINYLLCSEGGHPPNRTDEMVMERCIARREATPKEINCKERMEDMPMHEFIAQYSYINPEAIDVALEFESPMAQLRSHISTLSSGFDMPGLGFGVSGQPTEKAKISTAHALRLRYSLFDTDPDDESEEILGTILASTPDVKREDVFIVVKVHPRNLGREKTIASVQRSLARLKTDYIDLVLIKAPSCNGMKFKCEADDNRGTWKESWEALEELIEGGKIRSLGVSNFKMSQLRKLIDFAKFPLSVVQSNFNLYNRKTKLRQFCKDNGIAFMAHGLMGVLETENGTRESPLLSHPKVDLAAKKYRTTPGTILIRWALEQDVIVAPPSTNVDHIAFNRHAFMLDIADSPWAIDMLTEYFPHVD